MLPTNGKTIWKYIGHFFKQCTPSERLVLGYFSKPKQEAHVSVHSEVTLNGLTWWSGGCPLRYYRRERSSGLQLQSLILDQEFWKHCQGSAIPQVDIRRKIPASLSDDACIQPKRCKKGTRVPAETNCLPIGIGKKKKTLQWEGNKNRSRIETKGKKNTKLSFYPCSF